MELIDKFSRYKIQVIHLNMRIPLLALPLLLFTSILWSQEQPEKKQVNAIRVSESIKIDGVLDEAVWSKADVCTDFTQLEPIPGPPAPQKTTVKMVYDDAAIYIGAVMYDEDPSKIRKGLSQRDNIGAASHFGVFIDSYKSGIGGVGFLVTASNVQLDARYSLTGEDVNWNAVWKSAVAYNDMGWTLEVRIPYSALRFPKKEVQEWGINFQRTTQRNAEEYWWNEINPKIDGFFNQFGEVNTIKDVDPPVRLFLYPYVSYNLTHFPYDDATQKDWRNSFNGGMDIKYGINDAFTLDMTLIPDFGQTASDDQVLNLNSFEVQFDERRQFFTEGTELFGKGNLFYSRRIGGIPQGYYNVQDEADSNGSTIIKNPSAPQLLNASKLSGRTNSGLGIGVFNAVSARTSAELRDTTTKVYKVVTNPLTNYNVLVFDQNLKNNSSLTFINTNVWREGGGDNYEANVTGSVFRFSDKNNKFDVSGLAMLSQKYFDGFKDVELGHRSELYAGKISGSLNYRLGAEIVSDQYDHNDMGFLRRNNYNRFFGRIIHRQFEQFGPFLRGFVGSNTALEQVYKPNRYRMFNLNPFYGAMFKNRLEFEHWGFFIPFGSKDYDEPRVDNRYYKVPAYWSSGFSLNTDRSKNFVMRARGSFGIVNEPGRYLYDFGLNPYIVLTDKLTFEYQFGYNFGNKDTGWVEELSDSDVIFGKRRLNTYENVVNINYIFTSKMGISFRARHYWSTAKYQSYFLLGEDGSELTTTYDGLEDNLPKNDINYNAFTIDMVYNWEFTPGSQLSIVWKDIINTFDENPEINFGENFKNTITADQSNLFSVKLLYFIDYLNLKKKK